MSGLINTKGVDISAFQEDGGNNWEPGVFGWSEVQSNV